MTKISTLNLDLKDNLCYTYKERCSYCLRSLPNKEHKTKLGCIWCDSKYYQNKEKK